MKHARLLVAGVCLLVFVVGCAPVIWDNMRDLKLDMTKDEVLEKLGEPYRTDSYQAGEQTIENWYYVIGPMCWRPMDSDLTAVSFADGKLVSWGRYPR